MDFLLWQSSGVIFSLPALAARIEMAIDKLAF
jgi:hypothetical protein